MNVLFFPANKLNASICSIYNGHTAIVSTNTDRLKDGKYALAELAAFKHNIQCTSFLHSLGDSIGENTNYGATIKAVHNSGRVSFGLYWRSDMWVNPATNIQQNIPDYNATAWTASGVAVFKNAVLGATKQVRFPNHGQQMFDISGGDFGYDMINMIIGKSRLSETFLHTDLQLDHIKEISGLEITSGSYTNGAQGGWNVLIPKFFGMRNSVYSVSGNSNIKYTDLTRTEMMQEASSTRTWDAVNAGQFASQTESLAYTRTQIQRAINENGWFSDFMHWHSLYELAPYDTPFFDTFMREMDETIGNSDVWRAGNNEVNEYYILANSIDKIGSYVHDNKAFVFIRFKDMFLDSNTNGIANAIDPKKISTPISIEIDLSNTSLADKNLKSSQATVLRKLANNKWIVNASPVHTYKNGYMTFVVEEAADNKQVYATSRPVLTHSNNTVTSDREVKFVIWRKTINADDKTIDTVHRTTEFTPSLSYQFDTVNYKYYVGAISRSRNSSLIEI